MSVLGELLVQINGDNSGLNKTLNQSSQTTASAVNAMVAKVATVATAWKAVDLAIQGINYNKAKEQAEIAFGVFLGSAEKAKDMIKDLQRVAVETPLEFADVRDAGKQLLAYGVAAEDLVPTIRTLTDVSAGLNIPIKDLSYLYGTIRTQGRAMTVDINQFANRGIPIWEELAKVTGKSGAELRSFVEQGKVGFPTIEKAFQNMTTEGGKFFKMAELQMNSFAGAQSNLSDATDIYLSRLTAGMMDPLKNGMVSITKVMNDAEVNTAAFGSTFGKVFDDAVNLATPIFDVLNKIPGEFTAIGIAAGLAFAVFGPWGALLAGIVVSIGAIQKALAAADTSRAEGLKNSFLSIAESSKMTKNQTAEFLVSAGKVEQSLISWSGDAQNAAIYFGNIAKSSGLTVAQVANIAINSEATSAAQKEASEQFLKQNGLIKIGLESSATRAARDAKSVEDGKALESLMAARYPKELAAMKVQTQAAKDKAAADKVASDAQKALIEGQTVLAMKIKSIDALQKQNAISLTDSLEAKNKLQTSYLENLNEEYVAGHVGVSFMVSETQRINDLNNANLNVLNHIERSIDGTNTFLDLQKSLSFGISYALTDSMNAALDLSDAVKKANGELKDTRTNTEKTRAEFEKIAGGKIFDRILEDSKDWSDVTEGVYEAVTSLAKDGLEQIGKSLVTGGYGWQAWGALAVDALAKVLEGLGAQLAAMAATEAIKQNWGAAAIAAAGAAAAFVTAGALTAYADQLGSVAKEGNQAANNLAKTVTATDLLSEAVQRARNILSATSNTTTQTDAQAAAVEALQKKYQGLADTIRSSALATANATGTGQRFYGVNNANYALAIQTLQDLVNRGSHVYDDALKEMIARRDALAASIASNPLSTLSTELQEQMDTIGYSLALFQARADEAGSNISKSFAEALKKGTSQADFSQSIMDMLRDMAIDAAIIAGGFADKFKEIGAMIAEALKDGFQQGEVDSIKNTISQLYAEAQGAISQINALFPTATSTTTTTSTAEAATASDVMNQFNPGYASGVDSAPGGWSWVGERGPELMNVPRGAQIYTASQSRQMTESSGSGNGSQKGDTNINIQSNAPLDPYQTAQAVKQTMESLAFAGAV